MLFRVRGAARLVLLVAIWSTCFGAIEPRQVKRRDQAWQVLRDGLADPKVLNRANAVQALSLVSNNRTAERLAVHALHDEHQSVRAAAATSLGQMHATRAIPALKETLADKEISVVLAATYALYTLKDKSAFSIYYAILMGDKKASEGMVQAQLDRLKDPKKMAELGVQEGLGFVPFGGMGFEAYKQISKRDDSPARTAAARFLAHDPDPVSEDALLQSALADENESVRKASLDALAERGNPVCIARLVKNLTDVKAAVRYRTAAVIIHLSSIGPSGSAKPKATK
jgi:HEAT repeat protein